jgi:putative colanic acid biosynthesis acetyltransferase WcaF
MQRDLKTFSGGTGFTPSTMIRLVSWTILQNTFFKSFFYTSQLRVIALRFWGASIGSGVKIRRGVKVHFPWNLKIGDDCWIGEEVWIINHEKVVLGSNVCISQRAIICSGSHDFRSSSFEHAHKPIEIKDGAWVCLDARILPGVTVGECSVVSAGEVARKSIPDNSILVSGEVRSIDPPR